MSGPWFLIEKGLFHKPSVGRLSGKEFRKQFCEALEGATNDISPFIKGPYVRPPANEWRELRSEVFKRDDYTCTYCGERGGKLECDHIHPVSKGGGHDLENLTTACFPCNRSKAGKTLEEWGYN